MLCCDDLYMQEVYIFRSFANKCERMFLNSFHSISSSMQTIYL